MLIAGPRVALVFLDIFLGYALLDLCRVGILENGGVGGGLLPFDDVLSLMNIVHLNRAHGGLTSVWEVEWGEGGEGGGSRAVVGL